MTNKEKETSPEFDLSKALSEAGVKGEDLTHAFNLAVSGLENLSEEELNKIKDEIRAKLIGKIRKDDETDN